MSRKCIHDKIKYYCKDCGGKGICEHNRRKHNCKECGGSQICEHNKRKSDCKECDGSQICEHNKLKSYCKECGGKGICKHNKQKSCCKDCGGSQICEHNKRKSECKECGGSQICEHNKLKSYCKECGGSQICEHNKLKSYCKECGGKQICKHNRQKSQCRECGGGSICKHNKLKSQCKECIGGSICEHNKLKPHCKQCGGSALCKSEWCETRATSKYDGYCMVCCINLFPDKSIVRNYKTKEKYIVDYIFQQFPEDKYSWINDKCIYDGCSKKRPDLFLDLGYQVIIVEIDENQHINYDCSCENKRLMELSQDINHRPLIFIRFNPDEYITKDTKITSCWGYNKLGVAVIKKTKEKEWQNRLECLYNQIAYWCDEKNKTNKTIEIVHLFYDTVYND
jgi:hypothetical protein